MVTITVNGKIDTVDISLDTIYADMQRVWIAGGIRVGGKTDVMGFHANIICADIKRIWGVGGIRITGKIASVGTSAISYCADIKRVWVTGGIVINGRTDVTDTSLKMVYGDILRIVFVTLTDMTDQNNILLTVEQPNGIPWMQEQVVTSAWCWKIARQDGTVMGFTSHDTNIDYGGVMYKASTGFAPTAVSTSADMSVDNLDAESMVTDDSITVDDLTLGKYNNAQIEVFLVNYKNLKDPIFMLRRGTIGEITYGRNKFTAEIRGLMENFTQKSGKVTSKQCRTHLGTDLCKLNLVAFTEEGSVTAINEDGDFYITNSHSADYYSYGLITWLTGANAGEQMEIKAYTTDRLVKLFLPMPHKIAIGDTFAIQAGCDGNATTCRSRFNNLVNFRGEPYTPGNNYVQNYPSSAAGNIVSENGNPRRVTYVWSELDITYRGNVTSLESDNRVFSVTYPEGDYSGSCFDGRYLMFNTGSLKGKSYKIKSWNGGVNPSFESWIRYSKLVLGNQFIISAT